MGFQISHKLLALGLGGVLSTAAGNTQTAFGLLTQRGGLRQQKRTATWTAINQLNQAKKTVTLPRLAVDGQWLGNRAIGTYIPAVTADGTPNAVATAIKSGKPYRGVAQVVDTW